MKQHGLDRPGDDEGRLCFSPNVVQSKVKRNYRTIVFIGTKTQLHWVHRQGIHVNYSSHLITLNGHNSTFVIYVLFEILKLAATIDARKSGFRYEISYSRRIGEDSLRSIRFRINPRQFNTGCYISCVVEIKKKYP